MADVVVRMMSVNALINQTKAAWDRADEKKADADDWYIRVGRMLVELKGRCEQGQWLPTLKKLGRGERRARELMELAKGAKTVEEQRGRKRESVEKSRANRRYVAPISTPPVEDDDDDSPGDTLEQRWQYSLGNLCGDIIAGPAFWDREFPGWEQFDCPSHIRKLLMEAATVLASISATVAKRDRKAG